MKKIALAVSSALVAAAMLFAFVGCDKANDTNKDVEPSTNEAAVVVENATL